MLLLRQNEEGWKKPGRGDPPPNDEENTQDLLIMMEREDRKFL